jgi:Polyketide cyclase / dehydrase and lipid transport
MVMHSRTVHVDAPVEKVFDQVEDLGHFMTAMRGLGEGMTVGDVSTTPEGVGSTVEWKDRVFGIPITATLTCEEYVTNERIVYRSSTGPVWTLTVAPDDTGTTMGLAFEYHSKMPFFATIVDHVMWDPDRDLDRLLAGLKAQVET